MFDMGTIVTHNPILTNPHHVCSQQVCTFSLSHAHHLPTISLQNQYDNHFRHLIVATKKNELLKINLILKLNFITDLLDYPIEIAVAMLQLSEEEISLFSESPLLYEQIYFTLVTHK